MIKKILVAFVIVVVILGAGIYFLGSNLDSIVRSAVEKYGAAATQTAVKLEQVKIVLASGEAELGGLSIGSPAGFAADKSLYLGNISVKLDTGSLRGSGPIVILDIGIEKPQVIYEVNASGQSNLQTLMHNVQAYAASVSGGGKPNAEKQNAEKSGEPGKAQPERKFIIDDLTVRDGQIAITSALLKGKQLSAKLPVIHLTNIGKNEDGATPAAIAQEVLGAISNSAAQVANADLTKELGSVLEKAGGGKIPAGAVEGIGKQIKGLWGK
jgi:hypothetical protein